MDASHHILGAESALTLTDRELAERLGWFTHVRWAFGGGALLLLLVSWQVLGVRFHTPAGESSLSPAIQAILLVFLYNAAFAFMVHIVRAKGRITRRLIVELALGQILCDTLAVCAIAHFTGGIENFFIILVVLPLTIATELLPRKLAYATAAGAAAAINILAWSEQQGLLPHTHITWPGKVAGPAADLYADPLYVLQAATALTMTIFLMVFVAASISRRLRLREAELEAAYQRLSEADEAKSFFMRKAGHELRAPLAAIHSILEAVVHSSRQLEDRHRDLIARTQKRTHAMMAMVDELRRYSNLRSFRETAQQSEPVSLEEIVSSTVALFTEQAAGRGVRLQARLEPVRVEGIEELLREVVTNLIANAMQYTPPGGDVTAELVCADGHAVLSVADTGIGISAEARDQIFREFYRAPEARSLVPEGTGLGLAICKQVVRMHGGKIEVAPNGARGTVFIVRLPLRQGDTQKQRLSPS